MFRNVYHFFGEHNTAVLKPTVNDKLKFRRFRRLVGSDVGVNYV